MRLIRWNTNTRIEDPSTSLETVINVSAPKLPLFTMTMQMQAHAGCQALGLLFRQVPALYTSSLHSHNALAVTCEPLVSGKNNADTWQASEIRTCSRKN
jgi:hypothetical protein